MVMFKRLCMGTGEIASVKYFYFLMCYLSFAIRHRQILHYLFFCQNAHLVFRKPGNQRQDLGRIGLLRLVSCMFNFWFLGFSELVTCDKQMTWQTLHSHNSGPLFSWVLSWFEELCRLPQPIFHLAVHSALVAGIKRHISVSLEGQKSTVN